VDIILKKYTFATIEDLWAAIGYGALTANRVISRLKEEYRKTVKAEELAEQMAKLDDKKVRIRAKKVPENGVIVKE